MKVLHAKSEGKEEGDKQEMSSEGQQSSRLYMGHGKQDHCSAKALGESVSEMYGSESIV